MDRVISIASFESLTMTADIGIDQLNAFLARRAIELNCFDVRSGPLRLRLNCMKQYGQNTPC
jgi:hypothetical protein